MEYMLVGGNPQQQSPLDFLKQQASEEDRCMIEGV
jgi:hypothetical protein